MAEISEDKIKLIIKDEVDSKMKDYERIDVAKEKRATDNEKSDNRYTELLNAIENSSLKTRNWILYGGVGIMISVLGGAYVIIAPFIKKYFGV
ncbi:MAG: hypothetical protein OEY79_04255 [Anaplasmataceae bacterium]|nr:hypothetical protein [Anaplasmataceae bacterium]